MANKKTAKTSSQRNAKGKKATGKRKKSAKSKRSSASRSSRLASRLTKGLFFFGIFGIVAIAIGSAYTQLRIKQILKEQALNSFAVVLSKPYALAPGVKPTSATFQARLRRLRYTITNNAPKVPGQAKIADSEIEIFLRQFSDAEGESHPARLVRLGLDTNSRITTVTDTSSGARLPVAWLEPEPLSTLGRSERRAVTPVTLEQISEWIPKALIATEDERFYSHFGIDPIAIARAFAVNLKSGSVRQGGSTITQQLAKNLFYGSERTFSRKAKEAIAAVLIETAFSKEEILELYLNEIFLGQEGRIAIHGFGEASLAFFNTPASEVTLSQAATLVGIVKAPSYYSPRKHPKRAQTRRNIVLGKMLEQELITEKQYLEAKDVQLTVRQSRTVDRSAPFYVDYLRKILGEVVDLEQLVVQPIQIHSGIDVAYQECAQRAVQEGLSTLERRFPRLKRKDNPLQGALVSLTPSNGEFIAWVGGREYRTNQFEHVSQAVRQTGSSFKPVVYLTALDANLNSYRPARTTNLLSDEPLEIKTAGGKSWNPNNYDKEFHGDVTLRQALVRSLNIPAVQVLQKVGVNSVVETVHQLGVTRPIPAVPAIALGAAELSPLELARVYATIANGGRLSAFRPVQAITKAGSNKVLFSAPLRESQKVSEAAAFVLTDMLVSAIDHGTGRSVRTSGYRGPAAGKTGTTNDARDAWFAGYTPRLVTVVWVGFDDNAKTGLTGGQAAAPIWSEYMQCVEDMEPKLSFVAPEGVVYRNVDVETGLLATETCPESQTVTEIFVVGTEPTSVCRAHQGGGFFAQIEEPFRRARIQRDEKPMREPSRAGRFIHSVFENLWR